MLALNKSINILYQFHIYICQIKPFLWNFRYGREDEEVMGLKFCNEAIIALKQIWPTSNEKEPLSPLQVSTNKYHFVTYACDAEFYSFMDWDNIFLFLLFFPTEKLSEFSTSLAFFQYYSNNLYENTLITKMPWWWIKVFSNCSLLIPLFFCQVTR